MAEWIVSHSSVALENLENKSGTYMKQNLLDVTLSSALDSPKQLMCKSTDHFADKAQCETSTIVIHDSGKVCKIKKGGYQSESENSNAINGRHRWTKIHSR